MSATAAFAHSCLSSRERFKIQYFHFSSFRKAPWIKTNYCYISYTEYEN